MATPPPPFKPYQKLYYTLFEKYDIYKNQMFPEEVA